MLKAGRHFQAEAEAVAHLSHPHIVQIHEVGISNECQPYLALEYVAGGNLSRHIAGTPQPPRTRRGWWRPWPEPCTRPTSASILHRDLKPSNVLLGVVMRPREGGAGEPILVPKITDFGLARIQDRSTDLTGSRDILGTPSYMAPEQARAARDWSAPPLTSTHWARSCTKCSPAGRPSMPSSLPDDVAGCSAGTPPAVAAASQSAAQPGNHLPEVLAEGAWAALRQCLDDGG